MNKAFFFDRDGILNKLVSDEMGIRPPHNLNELQINYEIYESIQKIKKNYHTFIVSNQPDVARGSLELEILKEIMNSIQKKFEFTDIEIEINDNHKHKKPSPFMINNLIDKYNLSRENSWLLGDRWVDIEAGYHANINTILLQKDYSNSPSSTLKRNKEIKPDLIVKNFYEFNQLVDYQFLK
ncbi:HAD-IIIA family hydrolase [Acidimicrobiia bacterium]|nr:HAD-IIIA family hydrolase [Acidimicrobiia bacterium]